jgi:DNA-binding transcriptional MocR family regulator
MPPLTLTPRALYEEVAERLRERIFSSQLSPGSWIDETRLAEEYGISRTPLREALKVLATEGLVTMKMRRGATPPAWLPAAPATANCRICRISTPSWPPLWATPAPFLP